MTRHVVTIATRAPTRLDRRWFRSLGLDVPGSISPDPLATRLVKLLPTRWRTVHRLYAATRGYFWLSCRKCWRPYGGHQATAFTPDANRRGVCPDCVRRYTGKPSRSIATLWEAGPWLVGSVFGKVFVAVFLLVELAGLLLFSFALGASFAPGEPVYEQRWGYLFGVLCTGFASSTFVMLLATALNPRWTTWHAAETSPPD